jgi:DNA-binding transcriptional regulator YdaS (Cro superfamily)
MLEELQELDRIRALIDQAAKAVGNQYRLAKAIGYTDAEVSMWKAGRPCPAAAQVLMASAAGLDPSAVNDYQLIAREKNPARRQRLATALKKASAAIGGVVSGFMFASALWAFSPPVEAKPVLHDV